MNTVESAYDIVHQKQDQLVMHSHELRNTLDEVEETIQTVEKLPDKLEHKVMIPVGPLAFMEGSLVHTNEFLCLLGKEYYVWKSAKGTVEYLERRKSYLEEKLKEVDAEVEKVDSYYHQLRYLDSQIKEKNSQGDEVQEIIEYIPNEGEPVLIQGPKPAVKSVPKEEVKQSPETTISDALMKQSADLDQSYFEARDQGVIEENEVLVRGEWKRPLEEEEDEEEEEIIEDDGPTCHFCGKPNVTSKCAQCKTVWYCSRSCQVKDWPEHKKVCKKIVKTTVSQSQVDPAMPKKDTLQVTEEDIVEKKVESVKPVVIEREYAKDVTPEQVEQKERKPKKKSLFRQNMEKEAN